MKEGLQRRATRPVPTIQSSTQAVHILPRNAYRSDALPCNATPRCVTRLSASCSSLDRSIRSSATLSLSSRSAGHACSLLCLKTASSVPATVNTGQVRAGHTAVESGYCSLDRTARGGEIRHAVSGAPAQVSRQSRGDCNQRPARQASGHTGVF